MTIRRLCADTIEPPRRPRRLRRDRRGVAAVEFALVSLMMLTWIFGIMEVARAFWTYQIIQEVAIQGARCIGIRSSSCTVGSTFDLGAAKNYMVGLAANLGMTLPQAAIVEATHSAVLTDCANQTGFSLVKINYNFAASVPGLVPSLSHIPLSASSCFFNINNQ